MSFQENIKKWVSLDNELKTIHEKTKQLRDVNVMRSFGQVLSQIFKPSSHRTFEQEWDFQRSQAMSPSHRDEIDAIFRRHEG